MKLESDREIKNLSLQINTGNVEINHVYADRDVADEMNIKMLKFAKMQVKTLSILDSRLNFKNIQFKYFVRLHLIN